MTTKRSTRRPAKATLGFVTRIDTKYVAKRLGMVVKKKKEMAEEGPKKARAERIASSANLRNLNVAETLEANELIPQAVVRRDVDKLAQDLHVTVAEGVDDFDSYRGLAFKIDDMPFVVLHYQGHPEGTATIYLPYDIRSIPVITQRVSRITRSLGIRPRELVWQRKNDPDL
jgi:hypothetical protein